MGNPGNASDSCQADPPAAIGDHPFAQEVRPTSAFKRILFARGGMIDLRSFGVSDLRALDQAVRVAMYPERSHSPDRAIILPARPIIREKPVEHRAKS